MPEPLTIYECPECGHMVGEARARFVGSAAVPPFGPPCAACKTEMQAVRVFREEDVRPLWEAAKRGAASRHYLLPAITAFPAPEEWRR